MKSWRGSISHVPQSIFLTDQSIRENICLGFSELEFNPKRMQKAAKKAQISSFIESLEKNMKQKLEKEASNLVEVNVKGLG